MFCWFQRGKEFLRYESREVSKGAYQLVVVMADGTERVEHFTDAAALRARQVLKPIRDLAPEARAVLASVEVVRQNITVGDWAHKVKVWEKVRALEMLAKHFKLLMEQVDVNIIDWDKLAARLQRARTERRLNP